MGLAEKIEARKAYLEALKEARVRNSKLKWAKREKFGKGSLKALKEARGRTSKLKASKRKKKP